MVAATSAYRRFAPTRRRNRIGVLIAVFGVAVSLVPAVGQTVMVSVDVKTADSPDPISLDAARDQVSLLRASLEDGIMGQLFDAGFIVFSSERSASSTGGGSSSAPVATAPAAASAAAEMQSLYDLQNEAKTGGADRLVTVTLVVRVAAGGVTAQAVTATFELFSLSPRSVVTTGSEEAKPYRSSPTQAEEVVARSMGNAIGAKILSGGRQS